jgi:hypothetical protein
MLKKIIYISFILNLTSSCGTSNYNVNHGVVLEPISEEVKSEMKILALGKSTGVVFPKEYDGGYSKGRFEKRFTPSKSEIMELETNIEKKYLEMEREWANYQAFNWPDDLGYTQEQKQKEYNSLMKWGKKEAREIKYFDRQYLGFIEDGKKIIYVRFYDFRQDPYNLENQLSESIIDGWHGWFETNVRQGEYNLSTKKLSNFGRADLSN